MEFEEPCKKSFTIYSKSGCYNCKKTKDLLIEKNIDFNIINCDEYLIEDKNTFLNFIAVIAGKEYKFFPMVFNNGVFIGGFLETKEYVDKFILDIDFETM